MEQNWFVYYVTYEAPVRGGMVQGNTIVYLTLEVKYGQQTRLVGEIVKNGAIESGAHITNTPTIINLFLMRQDYGTIEDVQARDN